MLQQHLGTVPDLEHGVAPLSCSCTMQPIFSEEITPERMKGWSQSKNNTQLWMELVIEASSDAVKSNIA